MADVETKSVDKGLLHPSAVNRETTPQLTRNRLSEASLNFSDIENFQQLGLGRGVDVTSLTPWHNITPQQMRDVTTDNIVVTREKAKIVHSTEEICSEKMHHEKVMASAEDPHATIQLGVFAENVSSKSKDAKIEVYKVQTRSIAFKDDFIWTPQDETTVTPTEHVPLSISENTGSIEDKLYQVILSYIEYRQKHDRQGRKARNDKPIQDLEGNDPAKKLGNYLQSLSQESSEIEKACRFFIDQTQATHYVHKLELGAYRCQVTNETRRNADVNVGAQTRIKRIFTALSFTGGASNRTEKREERSVTIGMMELEDGRVTNVIQEGVLTVHLKPLHTLIGRHFYIRQAMESAIKEYMVQRKQEDSENKKEGPFHISCSRSEVYWRVNEENRLVGTTNMKDSSQFYFVASNDSATYGGDSIFWISTTKDLNSKCVKVTSKNCPLKAKDIVVKPKHKHLTLHKHDREAPVDIHKFTTGGLFYFKRTTGNKYIAMERCQSQTDQYSVKCVRTTLLTSIESHEKPPNKWILFKLHPSNLKLTEKEMKRREIKPQRNTVSDGDTLEEDKGVAVSTDELPDSSAFQLPPHTDNTSRDDSDDEFVQSNQFTQLFEEK